MAVTVKEFSQKHNVPVHIVELFLSQIRIEADENTFVNEEALMMLMKPVFEDFKKQNPVVGRFDPTDICK